MHEHMFDYSKTSWDEFHQKEMAVEHAQMKIDNDYIRWWHKEINNSDAILVLNYNKKGIDNYVGGNTLMEIGFAYVGGKKIFMMNPHPEEVPYTDELLAMVPKEQIIHGDISRLA